MNIIKAILVLSLLIPYSAYAACGGSSPNLVAASASRSDVADCVTASTYGDTITIPACASGSCVWTSGIDITKDVIIVGNGIDSTYLTLNFTNNSVGEGFFEFTPDATSRGRLNLLSDAGTFEVTGITFAGNGRMSNKFGVLIENDTSTMVRRVKVHSCKFTNIHRAVMTRGEISGVFYDNTLVSTNAAYPHGRNKNSWNDNPMTLGSGDGWYVEDNTFSFSGTGTVSGGGHGMGHVVRYNTVTGSHNIYVESHGNQKSYIRGTQITEIYGNNFASAANQGIDLRGGKCMVFFNKLNDDTLKVREEYADSYSGSALNNACVEAGPQICADSCVCMKVNHTYIFNNRRLNGNLLAPYIAYDRYDNVHTNNPLELVEDREFWLYDTSFDGTSGVGCGTLATRPATCDGDNEGYWATDDDCSQVSSINIGKDASTPLSGTLYRCTSTNTWTAYYTPYTYPHPLTKPNPPSNLRIVAP